VAAPCQLDTPAPLRPCAPAPLPPAFTLLELLIVIAVIAVLAVATLVSVRGVTRDAKLASAVNAISAALDGARALALRRNDVVLVVARPRVEGDAAVVVDLLTCVWTGDSYANDAGPYREVVARFAPLPDAPVRTLAAGVKVAAPAYGDDSDLSWVTQSQLPLTAAGAETPGVLLSVMYGPDGATLTSHARTGASLVWVDVAADPATPPAIRRGGADVTPQAAPHDFVQVLPDDEPFVTFAPFLAVYDDAAARDAAAGDWTDPASYAAELTGPDGVIARLGRRIHFNRYTGVAMR